MSQRVVIVGGGVIGLSLAWRLVERGARVTVLDDAGAIPPATSAAAGMLAPSFEEGRGAMGPVLYRFGAASLARWPDFVRRLEKASAIDIDYRPYGVVGVAYREDEAGELRDLYRRLADRGASVEWLGYEGLRVMEPALSSRIAGAMLAREDGQVDPRRTTQALRRALRNAGAEIAQGERAASVHDSAGAARGVTTTAGRRLDADHVVIAAGAAAHAIAMEAPFPMIFPVKGEAVALAAGSPPPIRRVVRAPGAYLCPKTDGRLIIGASEAPHVSSLDPSPEAIARLIDAGKRALPPIARMAEVERWAGLRPATPDAAPLIGEHPQGPAQLWFALGHYRNGVLFAPETAEILAAAILEGERAPALDDFRPDRFNP